MPIAPAGSRIAAAVKLASAEKHITQTLMRGQSHSHEMAGTPFCLILIKAPMFGFLLQWPTILTLLMFPVLVFMYVRLARQEEREVRAEFGDVYDRYAAKTPAWIPRLSDLWRSHQESSPGA